MSQNIEHNVNKDNLNIKNKTEFEKFEKFFIIKIPIMKDSLAPTSNN